MNLTAGMDTQILTLMESWTPTTSHFAKACRTIIDARGPHEKGIGSVATNRMCLD